MISVDALAAAESVTICGAGGHGRVVADVLTRTRRYRLCGFLDDQVELHRTMVMGHSVLGGLSDLAEAVPLDSLLIVAVGDNDTRADIVARALSTGRRFAIAIDFSAQIGGDVEIGPGTVVMPQAVVNTGTRVGSHVIVNTAATVDHDCVIGDYAHISPGAHLGGGVVVGNKSHIGIGASIIPGVTVGDRSIVGAGTTVIQDVPPGVVVVGNPAAVIRRR